MQTQWSWLLQLTMCLETHLKQAAQYYKVHALAIPRKLYNYLKSGMKLKSSKTICDKSCLFCCLRSLANFRILYIYILKCSYICLWKFVDGGSLNLSRLFLGGEGGGGEWPEGFRGQPGDLDMFSKELLNMTVFVTLGTWGMITTMNS